MFVFSRYSIQNRQKNDRSIKVKYHRKKLDLQRIKFTLNLKATKPFNH
jgi:hypothetical protein